jgi:hypothetical protein
MSQLGALVSDTAGLKAGEVVELKKKVDGKKWEVQPKGSEAEQVSVDAKHVVPFPVVAPAEDPARGVNSIEIMPMRWFLSESPECRAATACHSLG